MRNFNLVKFGPLFGSALLLAVAGGASAQVVNGSFDVFTPTVTAHADGGYGLAVGSTDLTGWSVVQNDIEVIPTSNQYGITSQAGGYSLDLTGYSDSTVGGLYGGVQQTVATNIGTTYDLSFYVGANNSNTYLAQPTSVVAYVNAISAGTFSNTTPAAGQQWAKEDYTFVANSAITTFDFFGSAAPNGHYIGLDSVSLTAQPVPEPMPTVLAGAGALVGFAIIRRRNA